VTDVSASTACRNVLFSAVSGFVSHLVALETHLFIALERIVGVLAAQDAVAFLRFIRTLLCHVAELTAVVALYRRVLVSKVPLTLRDLLQIVIRSRFFVVKVFVEVRCRVFNNWLGLLLAQLTLSLSLALSSLFRKVLVSSYK
jgi:hypothetical protein